MSDYDALKAAGHSAANGATWLSAKPAFVSLTVGSVCSGIGAPECAWATLGWDFLWSSDIEPFPNAVREARFQGVPNLGDMTTISARILAGEVAAPDVLVGGTPCQSFSVAGLRKGLADDRGNLALEFIRLADAIDAVRRDLGKPCCWVLWENVPGVLSDAGNAFGAFLAGMVGSDAPLAPRGRWTDAGVVDGPTRCAAWRIMDAQFHGLAQRRERVFVLARGGAGAWAAADALLPVIPSVRWHPAPRREAREGAAGSLTTRPDRGGGNSEGGDGHLVPSVSPALKARDYKGASSDGNGDGAPLVPCVANTLGAKKDGGWRGDLDHDTYVAHTLRAEGFDASEDGTGRGTPLVPVAAPLTAGGHPNSNAPGRRKEDDVNLVAQAYDIHGTPATTGASKTDVHVALRARPPGASEASTTTVVAFAQNQREEVRELAIAGALAAEPGMKQQTYEAAPMAVRRLTPRECERLQGFPDDWAKVLYRGKPAADGPRYRALGNSMAVPVLAWIGRQIQQQST